LLLEQLAHQPQRRPAVASALDQHVEDLALVADGAPEVHPLASNPEYHLVEVPASERTTPDPRKSDATGYYDLCVLSLAVKRWRRETGAPRAESCGPWTRRWREEDSKPRSPLMARSVVAPESSDVRRGIRHVLGCRRG